MNYAIYGSLGIARHVIEAIHEIKAHSIAIVVDDPPRTGQKIHDFTVHPAEALLKTEWDQIIIATMDFPGAVKKVYSLGFTPKDICTGISWDPFFLQFEPTTRCNFNCRYCTRNNLPTERRNNHLDLKTFNSVLDQFPSLKRLQLQGLGEPLLNPGLPGMLQEAKKRGISTSVTTNAALLHEDTAVQAVPFIDKLVISIDAAEEKLFQQIRRGGKWNVVDNNIRALLNRQPKPNVVYNCVIGTDNFGQLEKVIRYSQDTGPLELHLQLAENWLIQGQDGFDASRRLALQNAALEPAILEMINHWNPRLLEKNIRITYTGAEKRKGFCWWPFYGMFLSVDGFVTPCCIRMQPEVSNLGNMFKQPLADTWRREPYKRFRQSMFQPAKNGICDYCPL